MISDKYLAHFSEDDQVALEKALRKQQLSGTSVVVEEYEAALESYFDSKVVSTSSGSAAIHAALVAAGVRDGNEVILPGISPIPTILPVLAVGAKPVFVDIESKCCQSITLESFKAAVSDKTKAVICLPFWGYPAGYSDIVNYCTERGIASIEDAAQAIGALDAGKMIGTIADFGCFSTHDRKLLSTGEGGFVVCKNQIDAEKIRKFIRLGGMKGDMYGPNYKLSALQAALGNSRLKHVTSQIKLRTENANSIKANIDGKFWKEMSFKEAAPNYYLLALYPQIENPISIHQPLKQLGITTDYLNYGSGQYRKELFSSEKLQLPNTHDFIEGCVTLPVHPDISKTTIADICSILNNVQREVS
ncbi:MULTISPECIES: DegT/DnrJ/EryC1/StrS aminotransferase family protein [unclassified Pseudomonas]|uniref:DegT/DnrJ/EryC1/StrS family aminotransferase n=1 Tax=unclassified Pseudomonas TaxID=196821 RepID=UPI00131A7658|nr:MULTISPECIES: DegT/DnrJ/EryC1/StrS family aminotransferase [unclassified Pseudomonas]